MADIIDFTTRSKTTAANDEEVKDDLSTSEEEYTPNKVLMKACDLDLDHVIIIGIKEDSIMILTDLNQLSTLVQTLLSATGISVELMANSYKT